MFHVGLLAICFTLNMASGAGIMSPNCQLHRFVVCQCQCHPGDEIEWVLCINHGEFGLGYHTHSFKS